MLQRLLEWVVGCQAEVARSQADYHLEERSMGELARRSVQAGAMANRPTPRRPGGVRGDCQRALYLWLDLIQHPTIRWRIAEMSRLEQAAHRSREWVPTGGRGGDQAQYGG